MVVAPLEYHQYLVVSPYLQLHFGLLSLNCPTCCLGYRQVVAVALVGPCTEAAGIAAVVAGIAAVVRIQSPVGHRWVVGAFRLAAGVAWAGQQTLADRTLAVAVAAGMDVRLADRNIVVVVAAGRSLVVVGG